MTRLIVACILCILGVPVEAQQDDAQKFIGTWRLISIETDTLGRLARSGANPTGYIYYDATGHMAAQIQPDRKRPSWRPGKMPSGEEAIEALTGYTAYFGTYKVDPVARTVTHHREGALNFDVVDYVRRYEFIAGDRIALMPVDRPGLRLVWERVKKP
jgi:hypothetical protein